MVEELKELLEIKRSVSIHVSERHHLLEFAIAYDNAHGLDASLQLGDIHCSVSVAVEEGAGSTGLPARIDIDGNCENNPVCA